MATVICLASAKGGSGKTVLTANMAKFLSGLGKRVLIVDTDGATNGMTLLYLHRINAFFDEMKRKGQRPRGIFEEETMDTPTPCSVGQGVDLIPATFYLRGPVLIEEEILHKTLAQVRSTFESEYDYIILDAQAGTGSVSRITISMADKVVIVTEFDPVSAEGVERMRAILLDEMPRERTYVLVNKILPEFSKAYRDFFSIYRFLSPVPFDADVIRAFAKRTLAVDTERGNLYTLAIMRTVSDLLGDEISDEIETWRAEKIALMRESEVKQLKRVEEEIDWLREREALTRYKLRVHELRGMQRLLILVTGSLAFAMTGVFFAANVLSLDLATSIGLVVAALAVAVMILVFVRSKAKERALEMELVTERELQAFMERLEELKESRDRLRVHVESDLESVLATARNPENA